MTKSDRRALRTTAAVVGMTAIGAAISGTAYADEATTYGGANDGAQVTDFAPSGHASSDGLATPGDALDGADLHSFEFPTLSQHTARPSDSNHSDEEDDDAESRASDDDEDGGRIRSASTEARTAAKDRAEDEDKADEDSGDESYSNDDENDTDDSGLGSLGGLL